MPLGWFKFASHPVDNEIPRPGIRLFTLQNNTFAATGNNILIGHFFKEGDATKYHQFIRSGNFTSNGNTFWNPDNSRVFEVGSDYGKRDFSDLAGW